jgi:hypothetical protein
MADGRNMTKSEFILYNQRDTTYKMFFIIISALHVSAYKLNSSNPSTPAVDSRKA